MGAIGNRRCIGAMVSRVVRGERLSHRFHKLTTGTDFMISRRMSLQLSHMYTNGDTRPFWKQLDVRFTRSISLK